MKDKGKRIEIRGKERDGARVLVKKTRTARFLSKG
jgi:hypothetical protein